MGRYSSPRLSFTWLLVWIILQKARAKKNQQSRKQARPTRWWLLPSPLTIAPPTHTPQGPVLHEIQPIISSTPIDIACQMGWRLIRTLIEVSRQKARKQNTKPTEEMDAFFSFVWNRLIVLLHALRTCLPKLLIAVDHPDRSSNKIIRAMLSRCKAMVEKIFQNLGFVSFLLRGLHWAGQFIGYWRYKKGGSSGNL